MQLLENRLLYGCTFCFVTLSPEEKRLDYRYLVCCQACGATYHQVCYELNKSCVRCTGHQIETISIDTPPPFQVQLKQEAVAIKPSGVAYSFNEFGLSRLGFVVPESFGVLFQNAVQHTEKFILTILSNQENYYAVMIRQNTRVLAPVLVVVLLVASLCFTAFACRLILFN